MRDLGLAHNLGRTKGTISCQFRWSEADRASASAALNFERIRRNACQLLGPQLEILFVRAFLNFSSGGRNRLAAATVGAGEAAVTGFENQIC